MEFEKFFLIELSKMEKRGFPFDFNKYLPYMMGKTLKTNMINELLESITDNANCKRTGVINDIVDLRQLLRTVLGTDYKYLYNSIGEVVIDWVHLKVLQEVVDNVNKDYGEWKKEDVHKVLNIAFIYCVTDTFNNEIYSLKRQVRKGKIYPHTNHNINRLMWKTCPEFFNKYVMYSGQTADYTEYVFENKFLLESYVVAELKGIPFKEAEAYIKEQKKGLFLSEISIELECEILSSILNDEFFALNGELANRLKEENEKINKSIGDITEDDDYNFYHEVIMSTLVKFMGKLINVINEEKKINNVEDSDFCINYVSTSRIGVMVRNTLDLKNVTKYYKSLRKVDSQYITYYFDRFIEVD